MLKSMQNLLSLKKGSNMHPYIPNISLSEQMLERIGKSKEDLFSDIPDHLMLKKDLNIPHSLPEAVLYRDINALLNKNKIDFISFLGGGFYNHYIPAHVENLVSRTEFLTSYTSYQPEISQGMLQGLFEYQSMIAELTGLDAANASMYDGPTALAEAALMSMRITRRNKIIMPFSTDWQRKSIVKNYLWGSKAELVTYEYNKDGLIDIDDLLEKVDANTSAVIIENPSYFGVLQKNIKQVEEITHDAGAKLIAYVDPISLGVITPPGEYNADIAVGDGQSLGIPPSFGGPSVGFFAIRYNKKEIRQTPGRFVGMTKNKEGKDVFTLTLQTREQAIRRAKATSNICSNQALCAINTAIYLASLGKNGLKKLATTCLKNSNYLMKQLNELPHVFAPVFTESHFREFCVKYEGIDATKVNEELLKHNIIGGKVVSDDFDIRNASLVSVSELHSKEDMDLFVEKVGDICG